MELCRKRGLTPSHFYNKPSAVIFDAVSQMLEQKKPVDVLTVSDFLERKSLLHNAHQSVTEHFLFVESSASASFYLELVILNAAIRSSEAEMPKLLKEIKATTDVRELSAVLSGAFSDAIDLCKPPPSSDEDRNLLDGYIDRLELSMTGSSPSRLLSTPFPTINSKSGGTAPGEVTILMGPYSSGKSILGKQWVLHFLREHNLPCIVFTAEMPYDQWMNRAICEMGEIDFKRFREGRLNEHEQKSLVQNVAALSKMPLYIYDRKRIRFTREAIEAVIHHEAKTSGVRVVLIDYLQKIQVKSSKKDMRTDQEIGVVSEMLKDVAVQHGLHVIALASESEDGKVRNSREPEYDADNILNLMVKTGKNPKTGNPMIITEKILCSKWRDAERGYTVNVEMEGRYCRFKDVTGENA